LDKPPIVPRRKKGLTSELDIILEGVTFTYEGSKRTAINNIDLNVRKGEKVLITGPSGSGKTTVCRLLDGLIPHFFYGDLKGKVVVKSMHTQSQTIPVLSSRVGLVFQNPEEQLVCPTVADEIAFGPENLCIPREEIVNRVEEGLSLARLEKYADANPFTLSGGQQQSLCVASVFAMRPDILVLDEPTANLDSVGTRLVHSMMARLMETEKKTLVIVSHNLSELAPLVDRIVVLHNGEKILDGEPVEVFAEAGHLHEIGLAPPQISRLALLLRESGIDIIGGGYPPITLEDARDRMAPLLKGTASKAATREVASSVHNMQKKETPSRPPIIEVQHLSHTYEGTAVEAVRDLSLTICKGAFVGIIGQNGSGKSTLVKHFNGLLLPSRGKVFVEGVDTTAASISELARMVGFCFQNPDHQMVAFKVRDEIGYGPKNLGLPKDEVAKRTLDALNEVGMAWAIDEYINDLSQGERQKLAVASVLAMQPQILIVDEPTTGQDPATSVKEFELLKDLNRKGSTIIIVSHNLDLVGRFVDRVIVMKDGLILYDGDPRGAFSNPKMLEETSCEPPEITRFGQMLREYGIPGDILTIEEMNDILLSKLGQGGR